MRGRRTFCWSVSTLLFVVRAVAHLWRQEEQARNVQQIADRGAELYDKFAGFVDDLSKLGARIEQTRNAYDAAFDKLTRGRGNLVRQAEMLRVLGVQPSKRLPRQLTQRAEDVALFEELSPEVGLEPPNPRQPNPGQPNGDE